MKNPRGFVRRSENLDTRPTPATFSNPRADTPNGTSSETASHCSTDVVLLQIWRGGCHEVTDRWDLIIAHPPCTYLTTSGNRWFDIDKYGAKAIDRKTKREKAALFFLRFVYANCERVAIENPVGYMNTSYRKPDCIIHPYYFGDPVSKKTCLWLRGLPPLEARNIVEPEKIKIEGHGSASGAAWAARDENGKILAWNDPRTAVIRSKTFPGIARAMAEQWGGVANG